MDPNQRRVLQGDQQVKVRIPLQKLEEIPNFIGFKLGDKLCAAKSTSPLSALSMQDFNLFFYVGDSNTIWSNLSTPLEDLVGTVKVVAQQATNTGIGDVLFPDIEMGEELVKISNLFGEFDSRSICVRECYSKFFEIIETMVEEGTAHRFLILGNPGIGKSYFLVWLLAVLLDRDKTVVVNRGKRDNNLFYCFKQKSVTRSLTPYMTELTDSKTWYLADTVEPGAVRAITVLVSSPKKENYKDFRTYPQLHTLYMPLMTWEEITAVKANNFPNLQVNLSEEFNFFSGVPRFIFENSTYHHGQYRRALAVVDLEKCLNCDGSADSDQLISHYLVQISPTIDFSDYVTHFLSKAIEDEVIEKYRAHRKIALLQFLKDSMDPNCGSLSAYRGKLFENVAHTLLAQGGKFLICGPLGRQEHESTMTLPKSTIQTVPTFQNSTAPIYYRPQSKTFGAIDSWMGSVGFFQITTTSDHPINALLIGQAMARSCNAHCVFDKLYFVIPSDIYKNFPRQRLTATTPLGKKRSQADRMALEIYDTHADNLEQYLLVINL